MGFLSSLFSSSSSSKKIEPVVPTPFIGRRIAAEVALVYNEDKPPYLPRPLKIALNSKEISEINEGNGIVSYDVVADKDTFVRFNYGRDDGVLIDALVFKKTGESNEPMKLGESEYKHNGVEMYRAVEKPEGISSFDLPVFTRKNLETGEEELFEYMIYASCSERVPGNENFDFPLFVYERSTVTGVARTFEGYLASAMDVRM